MACLLLKACFMRVMIFRRFLKSIDLMRSPSTMRLNPVHLHALEMYKIHVQEVAYSVNSKAWVMKKLARYWIIEILLCTWDEIAYRMLGLMWFLANSRSQVSNPRSFLARDFPSSVIDVFWAKIAVFYEIGTNRRWKVKTNLAKPKKNIIILIILKIKKRNM